MTMLTLFMSVSGGIDWWVVAQLLLEISTFYAAIFMVFVVIMVLAMLNVINAIFVNDAMETTRMDVELRMQAEFEETKFMLERLTGIWESMTSERDSFQLDLEGFLAQVERDDVKLQFALVGVHFSDGVTLFKLLNVREECRSKVCQDFSCNPCEALGSVFFCTFRMGNWASTNS